MVVTIMIVVYNDDDRHDHDRGHGGAVDDWDDHS